MRVEPREWDSCPTELPCHRKWAVCSREEGPHQNPTVLAPDPRLPASRTARNKCLLVLSHPVCHALSQQPRQPETGSCFSHAFCR